MGAKVEVKVVPPLTGAGAGAGAGAPLTSSSLGAVAVGSLSELLPSSSGPAVEIRQVDCVA